jgi:hypothetical protein
VVKVSELSTLEEPPRVELEVAREGSSTLLLSGGPTGRTRLITHVNVLADRPTMLFFDKDNKEVWTAP